MVSTILRIAGLVHERRFVNYHRGLNRAVWNPRLASYRLLGIRAGVAIELGSAKAGAGVEPRRIVPQ